MSENVILVTGHKSPDTDSFCSALGYANLKTQMGMPAKAICAGKANKETSFVLDYFKVEHPEIVTSFAVRIKDVMEKVPAVDASASLEDILAWRNTHDMNRVPVVKDGKFVGVILPSRLIDALAGAWLDKKTVTAADIVSKAGCQLVSPELKLKEFDRGHAGAFPVVDGDTYFGMVRSKVEAPKEKQKVVLIDHNEKVQIIDDIEDAEIIENIDHHRIGGLTTEKPYFSSITNRLAALAPSWLTSTGSTVRKFLNTLRAYCYPPLFLIQYCSVRRLAHQKMWKQLRNWLLSPVWIWKRTALKC